jgi:hypothetical protein
MVASQCAGSAQTSAERLHVERVPVLRPELCAARVVLLSRPEPRYAQRVLALPSQRHLIKMWLECAVEETDDRGRKIRTTEARDNRRGIPQGSPISPLLANLYMRRFVLGWKMLGLERSLGSRIVTYADDLVILWRRGKAEEALQRLHEIMGKLKLTDSAY